MTPAGIIATLVYLHFRLEFPRSNLLLLRGSKLNSLEFLIISNIIKSCYMSTYCLKIPYISNTRNTKSGNKKQIIALYCDTCKKSEPDTLLPWTICITRALTWSDYELLLWQSWTLSLEFPLFCGGSGVVVWCPGDWSGTQSPPQSPPDQWPAVPSFSPACP